MKLSLSRFTKKALFKFFLFVVAIALTALLQSRATAPVSVAEAQAEQTASTILPDGLTTGYAELDQTIAEMGAKYGVDPKLIYYVMRQESRFKKQALSPKNAQGLMQLIPATAERFHVNIKDPEANIEGGVAYLRWLLKHFDGDVRLALAGYNAGERTVEKCGNQVPEITETKNYVKNITAAYGKTYHPVVPPAQARAAFNNSTVSVEAE
ncbi:MAG TPA: lytic transglycosylase domain-containing protein [Blastocatellia bacterium]|nr:lytic transglycosylase domain-containing protein [Blastocatellia bacterium]